MTNSTKKISLLVPCFNEEQSIHESVLSWLAQTRRPDEIIVVDDCSTDRTAEILKKFRKKITVVRTPKNCGSKSSAQEYGLQFVTGDILVTTDGDTLLHPEFVERIAQDFEDPGVAAVGGYVKSLKYNWITACRALDYCIGQNINKVAQDYVNYMLVIPGAAGAFRMSLFRDLGFDHDTLTEDLDFTYKLHLLGYRVKFDREAICYTQDPSTFSSYVNQTRRWIGGGWQNFMKHLSVPGKVGMALELSLIYTEGFAFSLIVFMLPFINFAMAVFFVAIVLVLVSLLAVYAAHKENRWDFIRIIPLYLFMQYVNTYIFLEQFVREVLLRRKQMTWFRPERVRMEMEKAPV